MKQWLRQKLVRFLNSNDDLDVDTMKGSIKLTASQEGIETPRSSTMRFNVSTALGGIIVQYTIYNERKDEHNTITHVIHDDEEVAKRVSEIVTVALLRN